MMMVAGQEDPFIFDDGKEPDALRTIGEVADAFGVRQHVLRYWEQQFPQLRPLKRSGGRRMYRPEDVQLVARINQLVNHQGFTLKGAALTLARSDSGPAAHISPVAVAESPAPVPAGKGAIAEDILPQLRAIRHRLAAALAL